MVLDVGPVMLMPSRTYELSSGSEFGLATADDTLVVFARRSTNGSDLKWSACPEIPVGLLRNVLQVPEHVIQDLFSMK